MQRKMGWIQAVTTETAGRRPSGWTHLFRYEADTGVWRATRPRGGVVMRQTDYDCRTDDH